MGVAVKNPYLDEIERRILLLAEEYNRATGGRPQISVVMKTSRKQDVIVIDVETDVPPEPQSSLAKKFRRRWVGDRYVDERIA